MDKATFLPRRAQAREEGASNVLVICIKYGGTSHLAPPLTPVLSSLSLSTCPAAPSLRLLSA